MAHCLLVYAATHTEAVRWRVGVQQLALFDTAIVRLTALDSADVNRMLIAWGHRLGICNRPFRQQGWGLEVQGHLVAVAMSASVVSTTVHTYSRYEVVECARLCSAPAATWATRVMLRLWRECCAPRWPDWRVLAAVSYSHNTHHTGNLYRFDGWSRLKDDCGSSGGGTYTKKRNAKDAVYGKKTLWIWRYPQALQEMEPHQ